MPRNRILWTSIAVPGSLLAIAALIPEVRATAGAMILGGVALLAGVLVAVLLYDKRNR